MGLGEGSVLVAQRASIAECFNKDEVSGGSIGDIDDDDDEEDGRGGGSSSGGGGGDGSGSRSSGSQ